MRFGSMNCFCHLHQYNYDLSSSNVQSIGSFMALNTSEAALRDFLDQPDAVIFVGSGLSLWSGLPKWDVLLRKLIDIAAKKGLPTQLAEEALANKQLLDAADALQLSQLDIANALRGPLGPSTSLKSKQQFIYRAFLNPKSFTKIEKVVLELLADEPIVIDEDKTIAALRKNIDAIEFISDIFPTYRTVPYRTVPYRTVPY